MAGTWLRCDGLARPLWYDEAATMLHLAGRSEAELRSWYDGRPVRAGDLLAARPPVGAVVAAAWRDEPQSGPLYFAAAHAWSAAAGSSLAAVRGLSVAASVAVLPLAYGVAAALFADRGAALAVAALVASSPLHVRYAQEARPYALWSALLLAWVLATLRARGADGVRRAALATSLYVACLLVHPLTLLALPAVAALVAYDRRWGRATALATIGWAAGGALAWPDRAAVAATTTWSTVPTSVAALARASVGIVTSLFVRPGGEGGLLAASAGGAVATAIWLALGIGVLGLAVVALATLPAAPARAFVGSSRVDLQACKLEYSIVSPK